MNRATFGYAICGVEVAAPTVKRQLPWAHEVLLDMAVARPIAHHLALPKALAIVLALASVGPGSNWGLGLVGPMA